MRKFLGIFVVSVVLCGVAQKAQAYAEFGEGPLLCTSPSADFVAASCSFPTRPDGGYDGSCSIHYTEGGKDYYYFGTFVMSAAPKVASVGPRMQPKFPFQSFNCYVKFSGDYYFHHCKIQPSKGYCGLRYSGSNGMEYFDIKVNVVQQER